MASPGKLDAMVADHVTSTAFPLGSSSRVSHDAGALGRHGTAALAKHLEAVRETARRIAEAQKSNALK